MTKKINKFHINLANYFQSKPLYLDGEEFKKPNVRKLVEQPWQEIEAAKLFEKQFGQNPEIQEEREKLWDNVTNTLCDLDFIQAKAAAKLTYDLVNEINNALEVIPDNVEEIAKEKARLTRMEKYTQGLIARAKGEITIDELEIPESITPWTEKQINTEIERIKTTPNRADRLRDFRNFLGLEANNLQNNAYEFAHFANQQAWNYANEGIVSKASENLATEKYRHLILESMGTRPLWNPIPIKIKTLRRHTRHYTSIGITAVTITPDGQRAVSGMRDGTCVLWDLKSGKKLQLLKGNTGKVLAISISPDGQSAISGSGDRPDLMPVSYYCVLWDLKSGKTIYKLKGHTKPVSAVFISPNGNIAISGSSNGTCILWDLKSGVLLRRFKKHNEYISAISITPDGKQATSFSCEGTFISWDLRSGKTTYALKGLTHGSGIGSVFLTVDGKYAITGSLYGINEYATGGSKCVLWDLKSGNTIQNIKGHNERISAISLTADSKRAISGSDDCSCIIWDMQNGQILQHLKEHNDHVYALSITPDGRFAISGSGDGTCILWDLEKRNFFNNKDSYDSRIDAVTIFSLQQRAFSRSHSSYILWDLKSGYVLKSFKREDLTWAVSSTPDGKRMISLGKDHSFIIWDKKNVKVLHTFGVHSGMDDSVSVTPDGKLAITGASDGTCTVWDIESCKKKQSIRTPMVGGVKEITITPDGHRVISTMGNNFCNIWDLKSGKLFQTFHGHSERLYSVFSITPDGKFAVSGYSNGNCIVWNMKSGKKYLTFQEHTDWVHAISITPDGQHVISGSRDETCIVWDIKSGHKLANFSTKSSIRSISLFTGGFFIDGGNRNVHIVHAKPDLLCKGSAITTIRQIWDFEFKRYLPLSVDCPLCEHRFVPPKSVLDTINLITQKTGLTPDQSPCFELPDEAWEHPGLLSECPKCKEKLKFNPFLAGGEDL